MSALSQVVLALVAAAIGVVVTLLVQRRQERVVPIKDDARRAAKQVLQSIPRLQKDRLEVAVGKMPMEDCAERWRETWEPYRHELSPELRRRLEALQTFFQVVANVAGEREGRGWSFTSIAATLDVEGAAEAEVKIRRYPARLLPAEPEMKRLVAQGVQLGVGEAELAECVKARLMQASREEFISSYKRGIGSGLLTGGLFLLSAACLAFSVLQIVD